MEKVKEGAFTCAHCRRRRNFHPFHPPTLLHSNIFRLRPPLQIFDALLFSSFFLSISFFSSSTFYFLFSSFFNFSFSFFYIFFTSSHTSILSKFNSIFKRISSVRSWTILAPCDLCTWFIVFNLSLISTPRKWRKKISAWKFWSRPRPIFSILSGRALLLFLLTPSLFFFTLWKEGERVKGYTSLSSLSKQLRSWKFTWKKQCILSLVLSKVGKN